MWWLKNGWLRCSFLFSSFDPFCCLRWADLYICVFLPFGAYTAAFCLRFCRILHCFTYFIYLYIDFWHHRLPFLSPHLLLCYFPPHASCSRNICKTVMFSFTPLKMNLIVCRVHWSAGDINRCKPANVQPRAAKVHVICWCKLVASTYAAVD